METERDIRETAERAAAATEAKIESTVDAATQGIVGAIKPARESVQSARESVQSFAQRQKTLGAEQIGTVARAGHRAAEEIESELPGVARTIHDTAGRLESFSESLRNQTLEDLLEGFADIARKRPAAVFGGALLAGFALSRFLKASATQR